jgi:cupin fold WbuC family metalloprotein
MTGFKKVSEEVFVAEQPIVQVNQEQLDFLKIQASRSPKHRARLCAHKGGEDRLHEMLIVLTKKVYIRPHKHTNKSESFHVIDGRAIIIFFDESGAIEEVIQVGDSKSGHPFYFRNDDPRYHTQIITSEFLTFHETTNGPFNRADTIFAPWSPPETEPEAAAAYLKELRDAVSKSRTGVAPA